MPPPDKWEQFAQPAGDKWEQYAQPEAPPVPSLVPGTRGSEAAGRFAGAVAENVNPMPVARALMHPLDTAKALYSASGDAIHRARNAPTFGEAVKSGIGATPIVGPMAEQLVRESTEGKIPEALGHAAGMALGPKLFEGAGKLIGKGAAPLAESALGIRPINRAYGRSPGAAALEETTGVRPGTIAEQAQNRLGDINKNLEGVVGRSTTPVDIGPARTRLSDAESVARGKNARKTVEQLKPMQEHLATDMNTQLPLSQAQSPSGALALKRGFGDEFIHNWNPETMKGTRGTAAQTYHDLAEGLHKAVPESAELDKRSSSLIPVAERAAGRDLQAPFGQRVAGRLAAHTGALVGAGLGYQHGGVPGGLAGLLIPEMMASPTAQMIAARGLRGTSKAMQSPLLKTPIRVIPLARSAENKNEYGK